MSFFSSLKLSQKSYSSRFGWQDCAVQAGVLYVRNLAGYPFASGASNIWREEVVCRFRKVFEKHLTKKGFSWLWLDKESEKACKRWRKSLFVMPALHDTSRNKVLVFKGDQGILVNYWDHFRMFAETEDLVHLHTCFLKVDRLESLFGKHFEFAFDEKIGFLTAFPEQAGTGLQVVVRVHLPAISFLYGVDKLYQWLKEKDGVLVRGFGGGGKILAHVFEISNYFTLGLSEGELVKMVKEFSGSLCRWERGVRASFLSDTRRKKKLLDRIWFLHSLCSEDDKPDFFLEYASLFFLAQQLGIMVEAEGFNLLKTDAVCRKEFLPILSFLRSKRGRIIQYV
ncbi:hypothetical protein [Atrimonas thermophila]|uniref:hypothetical protein n=1 Tax=Atrimonas thermophila TaxID=3064161 RepID=UPI00399D5294